MDSVLRQLMPGDIRRITAHGQSLTITLPPRWLRQQGIGKGDYVVISLDTDHVRVSPLKQPIEGTKDN